MKLTISEYLNQGDIWISKIGAQNVSEMDLVNRLRCARWLHRRSTPIQQLVLTEIVAFEDDPTPTVTVMGILAQDPYNWMQRSTLFKALVKGSEFEKREFEPESVR